MLTLYGMARGKLSNQAIRKGLYSSMVRDFSSSQSAAVWASDMPVVKTVADKGKNLVNFEKTAFFGVFSMFFQVFDPIRFFDK